MNSDLKFMELFGGIDIGLIYEAGQPWQKKRGRIKIAQIKAACIILIALLGVTCVFHTEVKAALEKFTTTIGRILGIQDDIRPYAQIINTPITKNGMTMTLKEIVLDKDEITASFSVETENPDYKNPLLWADVWIDGEKVVTQKSFKSENIQDTTESNYVVSYRFGDEMTIGDMVDVKIVFRPTDSKNEQMIGEYEFAFQASKSEMEKDTINFSLDKVIPINEGKSIILNEFTLNSLESSIVGKCDDLPLGTDYYLKGQDNLGNQVEYWMKSYSAPEIVFVKYVGNVSIEASSIELQVYVHYYKNMNIISSEAEGEVTLEDSAEDTPYEREVLGEKFTIQIKGK